MLLAYAFLQLAFQPFAYLAPIAIIGVGLGFYMFHNTLQTNATQMTPEARGTALGHLLVGALSGADGGCRRLRRGVRPLRRGAGVRGCRR